MEDELVVSQEPLIASMVGWKAVNNGRNAGAEAANTTCDCHLNSKMPCIFDCLINGCRNAYHMWAIISLCFLGMLPRGMSAPCGPAEQEVITESFRMANLSPLAAPQQYHAIVSACNWNSLFGGCVGIPPEFGEVWHQTNSIFWSQKDVALLLKLDHGLPRAFWFVSGHYTLSQPIEDLTRTWRPWSVTPKALSCPTLWSSVHQWRRCGRSLVANRWDLVEVEGGCLGWLGLVEYFTQNR